MLSNLSQPLGSNASKFKATVLWHNLVQHIYVNVKQKRRRLLLKGVGPTDCFSGSDVCDTALLYLMMDKDNFKTTDINRAKAFKLCQLLLEQQIFEPLAGSLDKSFEDDSSKYYKFTSTLYDAAVLHKWTVKSKKRSTASQSETVASNNNHINERENNSYHTQTGTATVVCNPSADKAEFDCSGYVIQELLGLTSDSQAKLSTVLKETNEKERVSKTATAQLKKMYNDCLLTNKRSSLQCEAAFLTGNLARQISAGTGTAGIYTRKSSALALDLAGDTQARCLEKNVAVRRSLRGRKPPPMTPQLNRDSNSAKSVTGSSNFRRCCDILEGPECGGAQSNNTSSDNTDSHGKRKALNSDGEIMDSLAASAHCTTTVQKLARLTGEVIFSPSAIADIKKEIALSQLSHLLDLPFLEGFVCSANQSKENPGYDNTVFFRANEQLAKGELDDTLLRAAIDVFDYMPNGHKTTFDYQIGLNPLEYKLALYKSILKGYRTRTEPLFPACHEQIHLAVLSLVMSGCEPKAVLAMRLSTLLLPCYLVAELAALLNYLHLVSMTTEPKIRPGQSNSDCVLNDFSGIFFMGCKLLSMDQRRILLLLMMRYCDKLTTAPSSVLMALERTMQNVRQGDDTPSPSTLFCNNITTQEFQSQQKTSTEKAIISLVKNVIEDTSMPLKEKQKHLKQFHKHHSDIMERHFSGIV